MNKNAKMTKERYFKASLFMRNFNFAVRLDCAFRLHGSVRDALGGNSAK